MTGPRKPVKVLIFSVSIGAGHDSVAKALAESLMFEAPGSEVKIVDTFQYINHVLHKAVLGSYIETLKLTPKVWGYLYEQAERDERLVDLGQIFSKVLSPKLEQLLREVQPDIILATHAFPVGILAVAKQRGQIKVPLAAVVTDFHVHTFWIHQGVDRYFVATPDLVNSLRKAGFLTEQIKAVGIPIREQFSEPLEPENAKLALGLDSYPTIMVAGGGLGLGRIEAITREILSDPTFQVVVVAGKNIRLKEKLQRISNPRLKIFGYVENMAQVMSACDIVISKPGGVTTAEVLAIGKPLVIYSALPGQEDWNTHYLLNKGVAVKVKKLEMLVPELLTLWTNPLRQRHMREMSEALGSPRSSRLVWDNLLEMMGE